MKTIKRVLAICLLTIVASFGAPAALADGVTPGATEIPGYTSAGPTEIPGDTQSAGPTEIPGLTFTLIIYLEAMFLPR